MNYSGPHVHTFTSLVAPDELGLWGPVHVLEYLEAATGHEPPPPPHRDRGLTAAPLLPPPGEVHCCCWSPVVEK